MTPRTYLFPSGALVAAWDKREAQELLNDELKQRGLPFTDELPIRINPEDTGVLFLKESK